MSNKHILVVGAGSVGKRHLRNLAALGCSVCAVDPREDRLVEAAEQINIVKSYNDLDEALSEMELYQGAVVASPPSFHVKQCLHIAEKGCPILLEKPVSLTYNEASMLNSAMASIPRSKLLLGYTYRWWPPLQEFRDRIIKGDVGKPIHAKFVMSAHLADWHPWEKYQDFFMSSKELGGGALLDESHFLDLMVWIFGMPDRVFAKVEKLSSLEIETDDNVDIIAIYESGFRVTIHLDLFGRPHEKFISVTGEKGTIRWSFEPNAIQFCNQIEQNWDTKFFNYERNDMFDKLAVDFLDFIDGKTPAWCTLEDGVNVLKIIESCRESTKTGCTIVV